MSRCSKIAAPSASLDNLVGAQQERFGDHQAERLSGREIEDELEFGGLLDRDVAGLCAPQNLVPISSGLSSWTRWRPFTVTSVWFGQARQSSRCRPTRIDPGSALIKSFGTSVSASQAA